MSDENPNAPIHSFRIGAVKASIWENQSPTGSKFCTTKIVHTYMGKDDKWHESNHHFLDDLPKLELVARRAYEFIQDRAQEKSSEPANENSFAKKEQGRRTTASKKPREKQETTAK